MKTPSQSDKHAPGYIITPSFNEIHTHLICLPNGKALAAILDQGSVDGKPELELAETFVRAVNSHDDMLAALNNAANGFNLLTSNFSRLSPGSPLIGWAKDGEAQARAAIAKAEGIK